MADVQVSDHFVEDPRYTGRPVTDEVVSVPLTSDLKWRLFHFDNSMEEGHADWGLGLARRSQAEPWRVFDEGNG